MRSLSFKSFTFLNLCWPFVLLMAVALGTGFLLAAAQAQALYLLAVQGVAGAGAVIYGCYLSQRSGESYLYSRAWLRSGVALLILITSLKVGQSAYIRFAPVAVVESSVSLQGQVQSVQPLQRYVQRVVIDLHCALRAPCQHPERFWRWWPRRVEVLVDPSRWSPAVGEIWRLTGKPLASTVTQPWGFPQNRFALVRHVQARFKLVGLPTIVQSSQGAEWMPLAQAREQIRAQLLASTHSGSKGILLALTTGDRSALSTHQWTVLQRTGTAHLMAISGLHVGLVCALFSALSAVLLRRWRWLTQRLPAQHGALLIGLAAAALYAALSGWGVPVQRAWVMLALAVFCFLIGYPRQLWRALQGAYVVIICADPAVVLSAGFWLSFAAVGFLLWQFGTQLVGRARWREALAAQGMLTLALIPLSAHFFQQIPWASFGANLLAIPLIGLLVLPLLLIWLVAYVTIGLDLTWVRNSCAELVNGLLWALNGIASWDGWVWLIPAGAPWWLLLLAGVGVFWLLMPALPARWWGLILIVPLLRWAPEHRGVWIYRDQQQLQLAIVTAEQIWFVVPAALNALEPHSEMRRLLQYWGVPWPQRDLEVAAAGVGWSSNSRHHMIALELTPVWGTTRGRVKRIRFAHPCEADLRPPNWQAMGTGGCGLQMGLIRIEIASVQSRGTNLQILLPVELQQQLLSANFVHIAPK